MSVAFFTIIERKILGSIHIRLGPVKIGIIGLFQPFSDAIKLFSKSINNISKTNKFYWNISPILTFIIFLQILFFLPIKIENLNNNMSLILLLFILGLPNFTMLWSRFFSFNKFSIIRSKRCISQLISYEIGLVLFIISMIFISININIENIIIFMNLIYINKFLIIIIVYILILSESRRIPFDFIEGESELVSGFNIEYSRCYFSLFFIYEYGIMLFFSLILRMILNFIILSFVIIYIFILIRSSFIRIRYDQIIIFIWKIIYPFIISLLILQNFF